MQFFNAFWVGGLICVLAQIFIDIFKWTPAKILVSYVVLGVILSAFGIYEPFAKFAGAGATVPLCGFGHTMANGIIEALNKFGFIGIFTGGLTAAAGGISAAVFFGYFFAMISKSSAKN